MFRAKNQYIRFIENGFLLIALIFIMDLILGNVLRHFYFKSKFGDDYHLTYSLDSTRADVIILGSSRAHEHYVPKIIEDSLNLTCFNTGKDGNFLLFNCAVFKSIIKRYTPQIILLDIDLWNLYVGLKRYDYLGSLYPYYKENKEIRSIITLQSKFERLKLLSQIYPFNSHFVAIGNGILKSEDINELKGYLPLYGNLSDTTIAYEHETYKEIDANKIKFLDALTSDCKAHHVRLIFIQSPRYKKVSEETRVSLMNKFATKHGVEFWNYVNDTKFLKPEYFHDADHLNELGAKEFTKAIACRIKREIDCHVANPTEIFK